LRIAAAAPQTLLTRAPSNTLATLRVALACSPQFRQRAGARPSSSL